MPKDVLDESTKRIHLVINSEDRALLIALRNKTGCNATNILRMAIRKLAEYENLPAPVSPSADR